jgi:hypothetical protein
VCAFSLDAQITTTLNGGQIRIKNNSSTSLVAFVVALKRVARSPTGDIGPSAANRTVETALETLSDAGRRNVSRDALAAQFKKMADFVSRRYLLQEQKIGLGIYQPIIGKLINLPESKDGSPFPPAAFVEQETAILRQRRIALLESLPSLFTVADEPLN